MNNTGRLEYLFRVGDHWNLMWWGPGNCSTPNFCGIFGSCNNKNRIACKCLPGFEPYNSEIWNSGDFSGGCTRISTCHETDTFLILRMMKVCEPKDLPPVANETECKDRCLKNCQCQAYSYVAGINPCSIWSAGVNDLQEEYKNSSRNLSVRVAKSDIEPTVRSCEPCGTNMIPYPLSTRPNCGDPMYSSFFCNTSNGQLHFNTPSGSYRVTRIDPSTRKFFVQAKYSEYDRDSMHLNELPFTASFQAFDSETEIGWEPPQEPTCNSSRDCKGWPHSTCDVAKDGKRRCLCTKNFLWNDSNLNCTKEGDLHQPLQESLIGNTSHTLTLVVPIIVIFVLACAITFIYFWRRKMAKRQEHTNRVLRSLDTERHVKDLIGSIDFQEQDGKGIDVPFFDMESILTATDSFSDANKLGQGGFGPVYKVSIRLSPKTKNSQNIMETVEDIVIVGAGIAGLTTSLGLHRLGIRSLVLESSDSLRITGFAFGTWANAWKALDAVGLGDSLRGRHQRFHGIVLGSAISGLQTAEMTLETKGKNGEHEIRCVQRRLLLEALANELPRGTIRFSSKVVSIEESGIWKLVHLADGTILKAKVLIGCDGVNSMVAKWLGLKKPTFTRRLAIRGSVDLKRNHGLGPKMMQFFGEGFRCGFGPCDDTTVYWFFTWTPSNKEKTIEENPAEMKRYVLDKLEKVPDEIKNVVENTDLDDIMSSPLRYRHPWNLLWGNISKSNVCVAGDALHPMTPDIGQGGCSALEDGVVLARCLAQALLKKPSERIQGKAERNIDELDRIEMGLKNYAKERRWRSIDLITTAYMVGFIQQGNNNVLKFIRDKILATYLTGLLFKKADFDCGKLSKS